MFLEKKKKKRSEPRSSLNWIGIIALVITLQGMVLSLILPFLLCSVIILPIALFMIWKFRYLTWQNLLASVVLIVCWVNPVRSLYDWWLNPVFYGLITIGCVVVLGALILRNNWKNQAASILLVCSLASGWQIVKSSSEIGQCYVEHPIKTDMFICHNNHRSYQQIENLPIGLAYWCWYCPWH